MEMIKMKIFIIEIIILIISLLIYAVSYKSEGYIQVVLRFASFILAIINAVIELIENPGNLSITVWYTIITIEVYAIAAYINYTSDI